MVKWLSIRVSKKPQRLIIMEKKQVRTGIVGSGFSASFHFEAVRKIYGTDVEVDCPPHRFDQGMCVHAFAGR